MPTSQISILGMEIRVMRVLIVTSLYPPLVRGGGAERSAHELAAGLLKLGNEVAVLTLSPVGFDIQSVPKGPVRVFYFESDVIQRFLPGDKPLKFLQKVAWQTAEGFRRSAAAYLAEVVSIFEPDVVHTNTFGGFGVSAWQCLKNMPLVHTMRDYYLLCGRSNMYRNEAACPRPCMECKFLTASFRLPRRRPDIFVGVSEDIVRRHQDLGYIRRIDETRIIYNQPTILPGGIIQRPPSSGIRYGFIGMTKKSKGLGVLLDAFRSIDDPHIRLVIAGEGDDDEVAWVRREVAADERIAYLGRVQAEIFYSQVDVVVVPSQWYEPFGRVAAEAIVAGRKVLVSALGGLPEVVTGHTGTGVVVDYPNPDAWASAMLATTNPQALDVSTVAPKWTAYQDVAEQYVQVYADAIRIAARRTSRSQKLKTRRRRGHEPFAE